MKKSLSLLVAAICFTNLCLGWWIRDAAQMHTGLASLEHPEAIDTARLVVTYRLDWQQDTMEYDKPRWDLIVFQIGEHHAKFYGLKTYMYDLCETKYERNEEWTEADKERCSTAGDGLVDYELFTDLVNRKITSVHHIPFRSRPDYGVAEYDEPLPKLTWSFSEQRRELLGYACRLATTRFGGRTWQAWYTEEIPCLFGPWKLSGLPGLVLLLEDSQGHYRFACEEIRQQREPIYYYRRSYTSRTTKKRWQKFMRMAHEAPAATFATEGDIYTTSAQGVRIKLDQSWTIPYNPIERE